MIKEITLWNGVKIHYNIEQSGYQCIGIMYLPAWNKRLSSLLTIDYFFLDEELTPRWGIWEDGHRYRIIRDTEDRIIEIFEKAIEDLNHVLVNETL